MRVRHLAEHEVPVVEQDLVGDVASRVDSAQNLLLEGTYVEVILEVVCDLERVQRQDLGLDGRVVDALVACEEGAENVFEEEV